MDEFFLPGDECEPAYKNIRDLATGVEHKKYVESLWLTYKSYADLHFRKDARLHFQERFWEMYLGNTFIENKFEIHSDSDKGPEFYLYIEGRRCWIEAIAPSRGQGPDAVPEMEYGMPTASQAPSDEIILRLRHAIFEKHKKYLENINDGTVQKDDLYLLAINSKRIRTIIGDAELPYIVKAVYPIGNLVAVFDKDTKKVVDTYYKYRDSIEKSSSSLVSTDIFFKKEYSGISAVIYSDVDAANKPKDFGSDFKLVHNKLATNPIPPGTLPFGIEFWVENEKLRHKIWG